VSAMVYTYDEEAGVRVLLLIKKRVKAKRLLATLYGLVMASEWVDHNVLEIIRGFLVYVADSFTYGTAHIHRWLEARKGRGGVETEGDRWRQR
jgi:hypothetical protein